MQSNEAVFVYLFPNTAFSGVRQHLHDMNASVLIKVNESETRLLKFADFNYLWRCDLPSSRGVSTLMFSLQDVARTEMGLRGTQTRRERFTIRTDSLRG